MKCINLGCGNRYLQGWTNVDFLPMPPDVQGHNLLKGIPYPDATFDVAYHSHILEHFTARDGLRFLKECQRVLKPDGILRVAVPDLESIATSYLTCLERVTAGEESAEHDYDWMLIEMFDQVKRHKSGGEFAEYFSREAIPNHSFVLSRQGSQAQNIHANYLASIHSSKSRTSVKTLLRWFRQRLESTSLAYRCFRLGKFRLSGEVHLQMYDRYSLARALKQAGLVNPQVMSAEKSLIPEWKEYSSLDVQDGRTRKPDSLFMEAIKPASR